VGIGTLSRNHRSSYPVLHAQSTGRADDDEFRQFDQATPMMVISRPLSMSV
jgi:hypothetical protein